MDMVRLRGSNNHLYVLLGYDSYSKFLMGVPLKDRKPDGIIQGLKTFMQGPIGISTILWDREGSFLSRKVQEFLKQVGIFNYTTTAQVKAPGVSTLSMLKNKYHLKNNAIIIAPVMELRKQAYSESVERVIRTIRTAVERFFHHSKTEKWESFLPDFITSYNNRIHSSTHQKPMDVVENPLIVIRTEPQKVVSTKLPAIGSYVRLNRLRGTFGKIYFFSLLSGLKVKI